jgi:hypothetical protein
VFPCYYGNMEAICGLYENVHMKFIVTDTRFSFRTTWIQSLRDLNVEFSVQIEYLTYTKPLNFSLCTGDVRK